MTTAKDVPSGASTHSSCTTEPINVAMILAKAAFNGLRKSWPRSTFPWALPRRVPKTVLREPVSARSYLLSAIR